MKRIHSTRIAGILAVALGAASGVPAGAAGGAEQELRARHRALVSALNRRDMKAVRAFYLPEFRLEFQGGHFTLEKHLQGLTRVFESDARISLLATVMEVSVRGDTARMVEYSDMVVSETGSRSRAVPTQRMELRWKRVGGVWKLAGERSLVPTRPQETLSPPPASPAGKADGAIQ